MEYAMSARSLACGLVLVLLAVFPVAALGKECTQEEVKLADSQDAAIPAKDWTWARLYESFHRFGNCGDPKNPGIWDAELATTYDGAVQHLLIHEWGRISELGKLSKEHPAFKRFVFSHINDDFPFDGAKAVVANAHDHCPASYEALCAELGAATRPTGPDSN
jgi:hypothetical protein